MSTTPTEQPSVMVKRGVLVQTDPSLKVYMEYTLDRERKDLSIKQHLFKATDQPLDDTHIFLSAPGRNQSQLTSDMVTEGLSSLVSEWISTNSFVEVTATGDDGADSDFAPDFGDDSDDGQRKR